MAKTKKKTKGKKLIGEALIEAGLLDERQLSVALGQQAKWGGRLGSELLKLGFIGEYELAHVLQEQLGIKWISLHDRKISSDVIKSVSKEVVKRYNIIPVAFSGNAIVLAMSNPNDLETLDSIAFAVGKRIIPVMALESDIKSAILKYYEPISRKQKKAQEESEEDSPGMEESYTYGDNEIGRVSSTATMKVRSSKAQEALIRLLIKKGVFSINEFQKELDDMI
jgi:type IV pilus assembly protein PilB